MYANGNAARIRVNRYVVAGIFVGLIVASSFAILTVHPDRFTFVSLTPNTLGGNNPAASGRDRSRNLRRLAALSGIAGSLLTRYGWMRAGHASARDWRLPLGIPEDSQVQERMMSKPTVHQVKSAPQR